MARIPDHEVERLKEEVSLQRLVELAGVELRRQGKDLVGCCPFHEDRSPSLVISPGKNLWHCLGACQAGGSVIDWVMRAEGVSFRHAVELLRDGVAPSPLTTSGPAVRSTVTKLPSPLEAGADDRELLERVVAFYAQTLRESPGRARLSGAAGVASSGAAGALPAWLREPDVGLPVAGEEPSGGRGAARASLQRLGVLRGSGHEHLSGSLVIPVE